MTSRGRGRFRRGRGRGALSMRAQHKIEFVGTRFSPPSDPRPVITIPFNPLTIMVTYPWEATGKEYILSINLLNSLIEFQTNIPATLTKTLRIMRVMVWGDNNPAFANSGVYLNPFDLRPNVDGSNAYTDYLSQVVDFGTLARRAVVGFAWPKSQYCDVQSTTNVNFKIFNMQRATAAEGEKWTFRVDLLWKPRVEQNPTLLSYPEFL